MAHASEWRGIETDAEIIERVQPSVVTIYKWGVQNEINPVNPEEDQSPHLGRESNGSAFFVTKDGYVVTNKHCVRDGVIFTVTLADGTELPARVVYRDAARDIAIVKVLSEGPFEAVEFGDSDLMRAGDHVVLMGSPAGMENHSTGGMISGVPDKNSRFVRPMQLGDRTRGPKRGMQEDRIYKGLLRTEADMHPGNSGGPMVNAYGEVVGVNTIIAPTEGGSIGMAIPGNEVKTLIEHLPVFIEISALMERTSFQTSEQPLEVRFEAAMTACVAALSLVEEERQAEVVAAVMNDRGMRRRFQDMLTHPATKSEKYAARYKEVFGVALYDAQVEEEAGEEFFAPEADRDAA